MDNKPDTGDLLNKYEIKEFNLDGGHFITITEENFQEFTSLGIIDKLAEEFTKAWAKPQTQDEREVQNAAIWDEDVTICTNNHCSNSPYHETSPLDPFDRNHLQSYAKENGEYIQNCTYCGSETEHFWSKRRGIEYINNAIKQEDCEIALAIDDKGDIIGWTISYRVDISQKLEKTYIKDSSRGKYIPVSARAIRDTNTGIVYENMLYIDTAGISENYRTTLGIPISGAKCFLSYIRQRTASRPYLTRAHERASFMNETLNRLFGIRPLEIDANDSLPGSDIKCTQRTHWQEVAMFLLKNIIADPKKYREFEKKISMIKRSRGVKTEEKQKQIAALMKDFNVVSSSTDFDTLLLYPGTIALLPCDYRLSSDDTKQDTNTAVMAQYLILAYTISPELVDSFLLQIKSVNCLQHNPDIIIEQYNKLFTEFSNKLCSISQIDIPDINRFIDYALLARAIGQFEVLIREFKMYSTTYKEEIFLYGAPERMFLVGVPKSSRRSHTGHAVALGLVQRNGQQFDENGTQISERRTLSRFGTFIINLAQRSIEKAQKKIPNNFFSNTYRNWAIEMLSEASGLDIEQRCQLERVISELEEGKPLAIRINRAIRATLIGASISNGLFPFIMLIGGSLFARGALTQDLLLKRIGGFIASYEAIPGLGGISAWFRIMAVMSLYSWPEAKEISRRDGYASKIETLSNQEVRRFWIDIYRVNPEKAIKFVEEIEEISKNQAKAPLIFDEINKLIMILASELGTSSTIQAPNITKREHISYAERIIKSLSRIIKSSSFAIFPLLTFMDGGWVLTALPEALSDNRLRMVVIWKIKNNIKNILESMVKHQELLYSIYAHPGIPIPLDLMKK
ncbi:hypothetical protein JW887_01360 [Candidatus Dojkabacteria bacterium]|nr:hypothetical protein [Candidatus Dojkabacteria bacterium]